MSKWANIANGVKKLPPEQDKKEIAEAHKRIAAALPEDEADHVPNWVCRLLIDLGKEIILKGEPQGEDGPDSEGFKGPRPWNGFQEEHPLWAKVRDADLKLRAFGLDGYSERFTIEDLYQAFKQRQANEAAEVDILVRSVRPIQSHEL